MPHIPASRALDHITVIDLTQVRAGPTCCRQLADWGANVIQVQMPESMRTDDTLGGQDGADYQYTHRNKRSITLNLKKAEGVALLKTLVAKADVLVENYRPDVKTKLGIDYESLATLNRRLVYASISGFGQTGPYAGRPGFDQVAQGMGGLMSVTGEPGSDPMRVGIAIADLCAGIFAAQGILTALLEREKSGQGQWVHTSLLESMLYMMDFQTSRWLLDGVLPRQAGNYHPTSMPTGVYHTQDGSINVAVFGTRIWERFCNIIGLPQMATDPRFATKKDRSDNRAELNRLIDERLSHQPSHYWIEQFNQGGVACGPIYDVQQALECEQVRHLGIVKQLVSQERGAQKFVGQPMQLSRTPSTITMPTPRRGAHTAEILAEFGLGSADLERLRAQGVL